MTVYELQTFGFYMNTAFQRSTSLPALSNSPCVGPANQAFLLCYYNLKSVPQYDSATNGAIDVVHL